MGCSVESRVPFLDVHLVEYAMTLPGELKIDAGTSKAVLRESMRGVLPDAIRERRDKMAFVTPEKIWFGERPEEFRERVLAACERAGDLFRAPRVEALLEATAAGRGRGHSALWKILCTGTWMERFDVTL